MKKLFSFSYVFGYIVSMLLLVIPALTFASFTIDYNGQSSPHENSLPYLIQVSAGNTFCAYQSSLVRQEVCFDDSINYGNPFAPNATTLTFVECNPSLGTCDEAILTDIRNSEGFVGEISLSWLALPLPPPPVGISFLGGTAPNVGEPFDGSAMVSQLSVSVGSTMNGLGPILAIILGFILTILITSFILDLFKETKPEKIERVIIPDISQAKEKFYIFEKK